MPLFLVKKRDMRKKLTIVSRIFVGLVFVFSGFVKGVDPWGTAIKFNDYFNAMGLMFLSDDAFILGVLMIMAEFIIGFSLLLNVQIKLASLGALIFMSFFTPLTLWLALENPVSDCGCFGDAIVLTNWQTFFKNIIIIIPTIYLFVVRKQIKSWVSSFIQWNVVFIGLIIIGGVIYYSYIHLPIIDFLPFKEGTYLPDKMKIPENAPKDEYIQFITLKDTTTGTTIKIDVNKYASDSTYWGSSSKYKYVSISDPILVKKGYVPPIHDFNIFDESGNNYIDTALNFSGYVFMFTSPKINKASNKNIDKINRLYEYTLQKRHKFYALTASLKNDINDFVLKNNIKFPFYMCDETTLKSMVRSNPGLMLLKQGTVIKKWSYFDFPDIEEIEQIIDNKN